MKLGKFEILTAWDGYFRLDGGAMFGIVPKPLWSKSDPPDDRNRILLGLNPFVIRAGNEVLLVDTGIGNKWDEKNRDILQLNGSGKLIKSLENLNITREQITGVIHTHLHFDHCGGSTEIVDGETAPTFPNAVYYIQQGEWNFAVSPNERTRASYLKENIQPLRDSKQVKFLRGDEQIFRGISVRVTGGHTPHHQLVMIESDGKKACVFGDLIPTASHLKIPYVMGYDTHPLDTIEYKKEILREAMKDNWLVGFSHSPRLKSGYLEETEKGISLLPVDLNG